LLSSMSVFTEIFVFRQPADVKGCMCRWPYTCADAFVILWLVDRALRCFWVGGWLAVRVRYIPGGLIPLSFLCGLGACRLSALRFTACCHLCLHV